MDQNDDTGQSTEAGRFPICWIKGSTGFEFQFGPLVVHIFRPRYILTCGITKAWIVPLDDDDMTPWKRLWGYEGTAPYFRDPGPRIGRIAEALGLWRRPR